MGISGWGRGWLVLAMVSVLVLDAGASLRGRAASAAAAPPPYTITDLDIGKAQAVNDTGQVVGYSCASYKAPYYVCLPEAYVWDRARGKVALAPLQSGDQTIALGINDHGVSVGYSGSDPSKVSDYAKRTQRAVVWRGGKPTALPEVDGFPIATATAINNIDSIVGWVEQVSGDSKAVLWREGKVIDLGELPKERDFNQRMKAYAINNLGQIVGCSYDRAFLWEKGQLIHLGAGHNLRTSCARDINDSGQIVGGGTLLSENFDHALLWHNEKMIDLGYLDDPYAYAYGINKAGQVLGVAHRIVGGFTPFLWEAGRMVDLNTLLPPNSGWGLDSPAFSQEQLTYAIGDAGHIVGAARSPTAGFTFSGYVMSPAAKTQSGPIARDDEFSVTTYNNTFAGPNIYTPLRVLLNDTFPDGSSVHIVKKERPYGLLGSVEYDADFVVHYTPPHSCCTNGDSEVDEFSYTISDDRGNEATAKVRVTIRKPLSGIECNDQARFMFGTKCMLVFGREATLAAARAVKICDPFAKLEYDDCQDIKEIGDSKIQQLNSALSLTCGLTAEVSGLPLAVLCSAFFTVAGAVHPVYWRFVYKLLDAAGEGRCYAWAVYSRPEPQVAPYLASYYQSDSLACGSYGYR